MLALFSAERENSYSAAAYRRAGGSSSSFNVIESRNFILLQGRKYDEGPTQAQSVMKTDNHVVLPDIQRAAYSVPLLSPTSALGRSAAEETHDMCHGESAGSTNAKASRYWYFCPSNLPFFKFLQESCYTCKKILAQGSRCHCPRT